MIPLGVLAGSARVGSASYYDEVMADSPVCYWTHDETSGATSTDAAGNYDATWTGTYTRNATPLLSEGKAVSLTRAGYATAALGTLSPTAITVESVISIATTIGQSVLDRDDNDSIRSWQFRVTAALKVEFLWWTVSDGPHFCTGATTLSTGTAYHIAATYAAGVARVYLNGTQDATTSATNANLKGVDLALGIGATAVSVYPLPKFDGTIDDQAIYSTALSAARILAHAQAGGFA